MLELYHGDFLKKIKEIPDNSVDLVLCDPPYGTTHLKWDSVIPFDRMWAELMRVRKQFAPIMLFGIEPFSSLLRCSNLNNYSHEIYWKKPQATNFMNVRYSPGRVLESVAVFCHKGGSSTYNTGLRKVRKDKGDRQRLEDGRFFEGAGLVDYTSQTAEARRMAAGGAYPVNLVYFKTAKTTIHPTEKPVALLSYLIKTYSNKGDTVLDFTMGSGSTGVACVQTGRKFIGIEIEEEYFKIAKKRIEEA